MKKPKAILKARGAWFLFTPPYSSDLNLIKMAFSKLKAHLRRTGARTIDALWLTSGNICDLYTPDECWNFLNASGYASDYRLDALVTTASSETPILLHDRSATC